MASSAPGTGGTRRWAAGRGRRVVAGPGSGLSEEPVPGVRSGRAGDRVVPLLPSRALGTAAARRASACRQAKMALLICRFSERRASFGVLPSASFLVVVGAALAVPVADLGDRGHVDGVVEPPVPAPAQPVDLARAGGHLDRRGPVVGGEVVPAAEAGHVADVADDGGGDDRADPEQPGQARPGRLDGAGELLPGLADPGIDAAQVLEERRGELAAGRLHRPCRR